MLRALRISAVITVGLVFVASEPVKAQNKEINAAVDRGVSFLKKTQRADGTWEFMPAVGGVEKDIGCTALVGLALLEADLPPNDPAIMRAVDAVSRAAPRLTEVYPIAAVIMFLDRYGDKTGQFSSGLIALLSKKLLDEQRRDGGWSYGGNANQVFTDNSNTQFAILGLWIAQRHKPNAQRALVLADKRFRASQEQNGGWCYIVPGQNANPTPTMTCAGLVGLFLGFCAQQPWNAKPPAPPNLAAIQSDPAVQRALNFLGPNVGGNVQGAPNWLYFLLSLERVCLAYEWNRINGVDWYDWGSSILLRSQQKDGTWKADHGPATDTAFALLFLQKSNPVGRLRAGAPPPRPAGPPANPPPQDEVERLIEQLVKAPAKKQAQLIEEYKNARGANYTLALSKAIPKLGESLQENARLALVERLETKTLDTLRQYLLDEETELRCATVTAAGRKGKEEIIPDLLKLLKDRDDAVAGATQEALKKLSGKDFGKDTAAWEAWWKGTGKK